MTANRKITALLVCLALLVSSVVLTMSVSAADAFTLVGEASKETVEPGDTFTVDVDLKNNTGLAAIEVAFGYDKAALKLEKVENKINSFAFTPGLSNIWDASEDFVGDATLCTATFTVLKTAAAGDYEIKIICNSAGGSDSDGNVVEITPETTTPAEVTVKLPPVAVKSVKLDKTSASMFVGETLKLNATVSPDNATNKDVTWKSSNASVISVDKDGNVKALKAGEATITATADGKSASCNVKVENAPCTHKNKTTVAAKESTCTEKGWDAYEKCADCGSVLTSDGKLPFRSLAKHQGGTATCTKKAVCSVCHQPYGGLAAHSYTAETKKAEALKTAGTCKAEAVYYYSCSACGLVEHNDAHTFNGDKDPSKHVGSIVFKNQKEATCVEAGYTGDKCCADCGAVLAIGTVINKADHTPADVWSHNDTKHWKECTNVAGCGVKLSEGAHSSTGTNVANCLHKAICDVCGVEYGEKAGHTRATVLSGDASGHWYACTTSGCNEKFDFEAHTPDREGHATEEYAIKCTKCGYVIEKQLSHVHNIDAASFKHDDNNHWNTCSGCNEKLNTAAHDLKWIIDKEATETEKGLKHEECAVCGFKKAAVEIPEIKKPDEPSSESKPSSESETKGDETPSNPDSVPSTGDTVSVTLFAVLAVLSSGVLVYAVTHERKRRRNVM